MPPNDAVRRAGPSLVIGLACVLGALSFGYAWVVANHLREDARATSRIFGRVFAALNDPRAEAGTNALFDLATQVRAFGIPIAVTDLAGRVTATDNVPPAIARDSTALRAVVLEANKAIVDDPANVNTDPYGAGWFFKIKFSQPEELSGLLSAADYRQQIGL